MSEQRIARTSRPGRTLEIGRIWSQKRRTGKGEELETDGMHCNIHLCRPSVCPSRIMADSLAPAEGAKWSSWKKTNMERPP